MKIRLVTAELFHPDRWTDGRTDRYDKFIIAWSNFAKAPKKVLMYA